ncbi:MAG: endoribonuclease L-PSP [Tannerellaceae bacterium]|nr:endoribonuclease L-PSP [Tannerellaceae bacterium]
MNYCDKIRYRIFRTGSAPFPLMADRLLEQLPVGEAVLRLSFFGTPPSNDEYLARRAVLKEKISAYYGGPAPALSYVSQPPLDAPLIMEVHSIARDKSDEIAYKCLRDCHYTVLETTAGRFLFAGGIQSDITSETIGRQSEKIFMQADELLKTEGFPVNSIVRQWNYIEQITGLTGGDQNYQSFNNARSDFYSRSDWANGYPAATGIGTNMGGVVVDFDAVLFTSPGAFATPIDNPLQIAAHAYSADVLKTAFEKKTTPKFERAKSLTFGQRRLVYISGTAAIRGEESLKGTGLELQLRATMENIGRLTGNSMLSLLRVYLKNKADYEPARQLMNTYNLSIPVSYMCADVCRDELLIEIEGIAIE